MNLLENHLEQITLSATAIAELPFPPPKIFTNALLQPHDITALIRDTESYERALFTAASSESEPFPSGASSSRKSNVFSVNTNGEPLRDGNTHRPTTMVSWVLGGDILDHVRREGNIQGRDRGEVDVELLLKGAEKLCGIYPIQGAMEKISSLRSRYEKLSTSITEHETLLKEQEAQLKKINRPKEYEETERYMIEERYEVPTPTEQVKVTVDDIRREEEEMRELEKKKRGLEDRVSGMEKDLGGLLR